MLTEDDVIMAVAKHLEDAGWQIKEIKSTKERGRDLLAIKDGGSLAVEAKGGTSSKPRTSRYGKPFTNSQKVNHVAMAFHTAARVFSSGQHQAGIAFPADDGHRKLVDDIAPALETLGVAVFLVADDHTVREPIISN